MAFASIGSPGVDQRQAAALKAAFVPGRNSRPGRQSRRRDQRVKGFNRTTGAAAGRDEIGIVRGRRAVERQDPVRQILGEHRIRGGGQANPPPALRHRRDAVENFRLIDPGGVERGAGLRRDPGQHGRIGVRPHQLGG